jgi:o-succinylbenzoate synthase
VTIVRAAVQPFEIGLRRTLASAVGSLHRRRGCILRLTDAAGRVGYGEASPAEWLGGESLETTRAVLGDVERLGGKELDELRALVDEWSERSPAAACALDTARLDLETQERGLLVTELLGGRARPIAVSALVGGRTPADLRTATRELVDAGYRCVKIKVGAGTIEEDAERVGALREAGGPALAIRVDANRAWSLAEADRALAALAPHRPAFVEEPLRDGGMPDDWLTLGERWGVPLAIDESAGSVADVRRFAGAAAVVVVKAARVGGPTASMLVGTSARKLGMRVVVTDSIEASVGRAVAVHLAAALHGDEAAVGLGGAFLLKEDPLPLQPAARPMVQPMGPGLGL